MSKPKPTPADKAFTQSDKHALDELKLEPWTPDRIIKAQELGLIFPNTGRAGWEQFRQTNVYPGAVRDVILFVYLSTIEPEQVEDVTWKDAKAFGVKRGLHDPDGKPFWQAYAKFMEVQKEISASLSVPKTNGDPDDHEGDDPKD
jgi:hypothetical protein